MEKHWQNADAVDDKGSQILTHPVVPINKTIGR